MLCSLECEASCEIRHTRFHDMRCRIRRSAARNDKLVPFEARSYGFCAILPYPAVL